MTPPTKNDPLLVGGFFVGKLVADRYRIVRRLGGGGMGTVYIAVQEPLGREVALKVVRRDLASDDRSVERFRREAQSLSQAHHPHIVSLYDFGELPDGSLYFAMELVQGENLRERIVRTGPLPVKSTITLMRDAASALVAAHALSIIHRDLKPENILLMEAAGEPDFVKLADFGVAKVVGTDDVVGEEALTQRGGVVGTPGYIAPEITLRGVNTDPRSDLYSLGVVWFECLAGRPPFRAQTATALLMAHAMDPIPPLPDEVPLHVAGLVQRLLAKQPEDRPESAAQLISLLDALAPVDSSASVPRPRDVASEAATLVDGQTQRVQGRKKQSAPEVPVVVDAVPAVARSSFPRGVLLGAVVLTVFAATVAAWFLRPRETSVQSMNDAGPARVVAITSPLDASVPGVDAGPATRKKKSKVLTKNIADGGSLEEHDPDIYE